MKTEEGNKLIAEFMGRETFNRFGASVVSRMEYHTSWDWQVPVWAKVNPLLVTLAMTAYNARKQHNFFNKYSEAVCANDLLKGFEILVEAIEWYNKEQTQKTD